MGEKKEPCSGDHFILLGYSPNEILMGTRYDGERVCSCGPGDTRFWLCGMSRLQLIRKDQTNTYLYFGNNISPYMVSCLCFQVSCIDHRWQKVLPRLLHVHVQRRYFVQQSTIVTKNILSRVPNHTLGSLCILYLFQLSFLPPIDLSFIIMETACLLDSLLTCIYFTSIASMGFFCTYNYTKSVGIVATALKVLIFIGRARPIDDFFLSFFPRGG